ncbi:two-component system response regulator [Eisenbergiella sp.]
MGTMKKILIVEDQESDRKILCQILSDNYEVLEAENGRQALEVLERYGEAVSLILLDIHMPVMDGYKFLSIIKSDVSVSSIPVIVATQSDSEADEVNALSKGAADFVAKPYKPQIIRRRVANIINLRETAAKMNQFKYDRLTGLYSKEYFYERVREILLQNPDKEYDILCSDVENFKMINDVFGILAGNKLLCGIAGVYQREAEEGSICGRLSADRFACLQEHRAEYTDERFIRILEQVNALSEEKKVMMKWGIYPLATAAIPIEQMYDRALLAAQSIKGKYGKYFAVYDEKLRSIWLHNQEITDSMEAALAKEQFIIYLQPKYRIADGSLAGAEALVRWEHPEWGLQSPAEFIPLFEKNGFITRLDRYVWDKVCALLHKWGEEGETVLPVSVNVSRADIYHTDIIEILMEMIRKYDLPPALLHLEITESAYTESPQQIMDTIGCLRERGFVIEMDDFGSGYSSLNMLSKMPVDILKLDLKFVQSEIEVPGSEGILQFIMELARMMKLTVVAEGVETKKQLERLAEIGCDCVQGYYFAKPMPVDEFEQLLKQWNDGKHSSSVSCIPSTKPVNDAERPE